MNQILLSFKNLIEVHKKEIGQLSWKTQNPKNNWQTCRLTKLLQMEK
jgi:hypothetical protein